MTSEAVSTLKIRTTKGTMSSSSRACFSDGFLASNVIWLRWRQGHHRMQHLEAFCSCQRLVYGKNGEMGKGWDTSEKSNPQFWKGIFWGSTSMLSCGNPVNPWYLIHTQTVFSHRKVVITAKASMSNELNSNMKPWTERIPWMNFPLPVNLSNRKKLYDFPILYKAHCLRSPDVIIWLDLCIRISSLSKHTIVVTNYTQKSVAQITSHLFVWKHVLAV